MCIENLYQYGCSVPLSLRYSMKKLMKILLLCCIIAMQCGFASAGIRVWEDSKGNQIKGQYTGILYDSVEIEDLSGKSQFIPLKDLSRKDRSYVDKIYVPPIKISFIFSKEKKIRASNALPDDHIIIVKGSVDIKDESRTPCNTLSATVCLIGKEVATDDYRLMNKIVSPVTLTAENDYKCHLELDTESRHYIEYNYQKRGTEYIGYVVALQRLGETNVVKFSSNLKWMNEEKFSSLNHLQPGSFFDQECQQTPVPRPVYSTFRVGIQ